MLGYRVHEVSVLHVYKYRFIVKTKKSHEEVYVAQATSIVLMS